MPPIATHTRGVSIPLHEAAPTGRLPDAPASFGSPSDRATDGFLAPLPTWVSRLPAVIRGRLFEPASPATAEGPASVPSPVQVMLGGARYMVDVIARGLPLAERRGQFLGAEIELYSNVGRTLLLRGIAERYREAGYEVREIEEAHYSFSTAPKIWRSEVETLAIPGGHQLTIHYFQGSAGTVATIVTPDEIRTALTIDADSHHIKKLAYTLAGEMLKADIDPLATTGTTTHLLTVKATDKDLFHVRAAMEGGRVVLTGLSGSFVTETGQAVSQLTLDEGIGLDRAQDELLRRLHRGQVLKSDPMTRIEVQVPGRADPLHLDIRFDVYPIQEVVPSKVAAGEMHLLDPLFGYMEQPGPGVVLQGTGSKNLVSFHVHREVPWQDVAGRLTIAHLLEVHREWLRHHQEVGAVVPTLAARKIFAVPVPENVRDIILDPKFIQDPTRIVDILDYMGLIVSQTPPKYHDFNPENWFGFFLDHLKEQRLLRPGELIPSERFSGDVYRVNEGPKIQVWKVSASGEEIPLVRLPGPAIPTVELRIADSHLDKDYMRFLMQFMAGMGQPAPVSWSTATPNIVLKTAARIGGATAGLARGGAIFLMGDMGSEAVLGHWEYFKSLSVPHVARNFAWLAAGGRAAQLASAAALRTAPLSALPGLFKSAIGRAFPLLGALTAQEYGATGTIDLAQLPKSLVAVTLAREIVQSSVTRMGKSTALSSAAKFLRIPKAVTSPTILGLVTIVADFTLFKIFRGMMDHGAEAGRLNAMTEAVGTLITHMVQGQAAPQAYIARVRTELDEVIAALEMGQTLEEYQVQQEFQAAKTALDLWYDEEELRPLDGSRSRAELDALYREDLARLQRERDQDLASLQVAPTFRPLPVSTGDNWAEFWDAVDDYDLHVDANMDGEPMHDPDVLRYQALLDRNPRILALQLKQFRENWNAAIQRHKDRAPGFPRGVAVASR